MQKAAGMVLILGTLVAVEHSSATGTLSPAALLKRQIVDCMTKRMTTNQSISYNEASRLCKAQLQPQNSALVSSVTKPGTSH
jgi:hypothetical protein